MMCHEHSFPETSYRARRAAVATQALSANRVMHASELRRALHLPGALCWPPPHVLLAKLLAELLIQPARPSPRGRRDSGLDRNYW